MTPAFTALAMAAFAANSILCRMALAETSIDAATFTFLRIASGALVLAIIVRARNTPRMATMRPGPSWKAATALFAYAACFSFFLESLDAATKRLSNFIDKATQATLVGDVFDDAATGQGLLNYFLRAHNSGAVTDDEVTKTGLTLEEIQSRSFVKVLENRKT